MSEINFDNSSEFWFLPKLMQGANVFHSFIHEHFAIFEKAFIFSWRKSTENLLPFLHSVHGFLHESNFLLHSKKYLTILAIGSQ